MMDNEQEYINIHQLMNGPTLFTHNGIFSSV